MGCIPCAQTGKRGVQIRKELLRGRWPSHNGQAAASWVGGMEEADTQVVVDDWYFNFGPHCSSFPSGNKNLGGERELYLPNYLI